MFVFGMNSIDMLFCVVVCASTVFCRIHIQELLKRYICSNEVESVEIQHLCILSENVFIDFA